MSEASQQTQQTGEVAEAGISCPMCGSKTPNLIRIESGLRLRMQEQGLANIPDEVCAVCIKDLRKTISKGAQLRADEEVKANKKQDLWRNRIKLIKQGRNLLNLKDYGEAVICYEKYVKVLEIVYGLPLDKLDPKLFHDRPKEITVICSVLWDLMLIYDAHPKYSGKQERIAKKLAEFLRFTPIYTSIIRKAELEYRKAKNPAAFKNFLKLCDVNASKCFVATAAFEGGTHPVVMTLRAFRDQKLKSSQGGRYFVLFYYRHSPSWAQWLNRHPKIKPLVRFLLRRVASLVQLLA